MYLEEHVGTTNKHPTEGDSRLSEVQHKYNLLSSEMDLMRINIELIVELIDRLWEGSEKTKRVILEKLKLALAETSSRR